MAALMERALELSDYHAKRQRFAEENPRREVKKGIGLASFLHGGDSPAPANAIWRRWSALEATPEGQVRVLAASTEMGQGTTTVFSQIAAEALGVDYD